MQQTPDGTTPSVEPFVKRMAKIVFETNVRPKGKGGGKGAIKIEDFHLSDEDQRIYTKLHAEFFCNGALIVSKSAQDIERIMPTTVFLEALPRLAKARALSVTFWEHAAATPKFWRKVKGF